MAEVATSVVHEVLTRPTRDVDKRSSTKPSRSSPTTTSTSASTATAPSRPSVGDLLGHYEEGLSVCSKLSDKFGKHGNANRELAVRSLATPLRMFDGIDDEPPKKNVEVPDGRVLPERESLKLERRKREDERQRGLIADAFGRNGTLKLECHARCVCKARRRR